MIKDMKVDCFLPYLEGANNERIIEDIFGCDEVNKVNVFYSKDIKLQPALLANTNAIYIDNIFSTSTIKLLAEKTNSEYTLFCFNKANLTFGENSIKRLLSVAIYTNAEMVYSDYYSVLEGNITQHPVIDYQFGSLRNDFDFGSVVLIKTSTLKLWAEEDSTNYKYAGWYSLRLFLSRQGELFHLNEYLYTETNIDLRNSGEKQFDYVNPSNRDVQIEMEKVFTAHLRKIGGWIDVTKYKTPVLEDYIFPVEASVIIPVFNRVKTITDAINSVITQKANFKFNVIIVDNHSNDGTTMAIEQFAKQDNRIVHLIPERYDLGIGGCWNYALESPLCGKFAVQLDLSLIHI